MKPVCGCLRREIATFVVFALAVVAGAPAALGQSAILDFRKSFQKAVADGDFSTQRKLVAENRDIALQAAFGLEQDICLSKTGAAEDDPQKFIDVYDALALNFKVAHDQDQILVDRKKWLLKLDEAGLKSRLEAARAYDAAGTAWDDHISNGGDESVKESVNHFVNALNASSAIDDYYVAAASADYAAQGTEKLGDAFATAYFTKMSLRAAGLGHYLARHAHTQVRKDKLMKGDIKRFDLIDISIPLEESRKKYEVDYAESLKVKPVPGGNGEGGGGDDSGSGKGNTGGGEALVPPTSEAAYEWVEDKGFKSTTVPVRKKVFLPSFNPGYSPTQPARLPFVSTVTVRKEADPTEFRFLPAATVSYDGKVYLDADGPKGRGRASKVKLKLKPTKHTFRVEYDDDSKAKLSFMLFERETKFKLFGVDLKAPEAHTFINISGYSMSGVKGKVRGHPVTIVDGNANGYFNEAGLDAIIVGSGSKARIEPFGRYIFLEEKGGLYPYEIKANKYKNASIVRTRPFQGALAPLRVKYSTGSGIRPKYLVAKGTGEDSAFFFDLMKAVDRPVWIPIGGYTIYQGYFLFKEGTKSETSILIDKGRSGTFKVEPGKLNVWELGGTGERGFWMIGHLKRGDKPSDVVAVGKELRVYGNFGEGYFNFLAGRVKPTVILKKESEKGITLATEEMRFPHDVDGDSNILYFPADERIKNMPRGKIVGRFTANHEILGKMASEWIEVQ